MNACAVRGCQKSRKYRDWCPMHYQRFKKHGNTSTVKTPSNWGPDTCRM